MSPVNFVSFVVPGQPHGRARARSTRTGRHYTPQKTVSTKRSSPRRPDWPCAGQNHSRACGGRNGGDPYPPPS